MKSFAKTTLVLSSFLFSVNYLIPVNALDAPDGFTQSEDWTDPTPSDIAAHENYLQIAEEAEKGYHPQARDNISLAKLAPRKAADGSVLVGQAWATSGISRFYQEDYPNVLLCSTQTATIASAGCVVTSFAMVANKYGYNTTPPEVVSQINTYAPGTQTACSFPWASMVNLPKYSGLKYQNNTDLSYKESLQLQSIRGALNTGKPVVVYMNKLSGGSHAVVCYGYEAYNVNGNIVYYHYIFNPSRGAASKTTIEDYMADWYIKGVHVYYK